MSFVPRFLSLSAVLAATVALAACGGSSGSSTTTSTSGGSSASSGTSNAQDAARVKLVQCVREQGVDLPDITDDSNALAQLTPAERERAEAALQGPCKKYASKAFGDTDPQSPEFLDALTKYTVCLRKNGVDVPDPDPNAPRAGLMSLDQSDPTVAAAMSACEDERPSMDSGR
jgi:hypothetical protein